MKELKRHYHRYKIYGMQDILMCTKILEGKYVYCTGCSAYEL